MGLPAIGPMRSRALLSVAGHLKPRAVIFGFYFGNDLADDFIAGSGRLSEFFSDADVASLQAIEQRQTLAAQLDALVSPTLLFHGATAVQRSWPTPPALAVVVARSRVLGLIGNIMRRMAAPAPTRAFVLTRFEDAIKGLSDQTTRQLAPFNDGGWKTILTCARRFAVLDTSDLRIRAGLAIAKKEIVAMKHESERLGARYVVVLLPTKEFVFQNRIKRRSSYPDFDRLVTTERAIKLDLIATFQTAGIEYVDPLDPLMRASRQPYHENADGHPNAVGHAIIASELAAYLRRSATLRQSVGPN
jgi:hypothetical protein